MARKPLNRKTDKRSKRTIDLIAKGLADAEARRFAPETVTVDKNGAQKTTQVLVNFPIAIAFFNDAKKNILIRTTPFTHELNPEMIKPFEQKTIYIQQGFLKLWDQGGYFQLLVE